ncbi:MAG: hypothetical protein WC376_02765 [Candidatus Nanoarchaeia archaeon]
MKLFIYLYPITMYVNWEIHNNAWSYYHERGLENREKGIAEYNIKIKSINNFINDYRKKGFKIAYLGFSKPSGELNKSLFSKIFNFLDTDSFINSKVTFRNHCKNEVYPDEKSIIKELMPLEELIVSGFHYSDCVEKFKNAAKELGVLSKIDGALTNNFFYLIKKSDDVYKELEMLQIEADEFKKRYGF